MPIGVAKVQHHAQLVSMSDARDSLGRGLRHISCKNLKNWLVFYPSSFRELGDELINALYQVCVPFGMEVSYPTVYDTATRVVHGTNDVCR